MMQTFCNTLKRYSLLVLTAALSCWDAVPAQAQINFAMSGAHGTSSRNTATASSAYAEKTAVIIPNYDKPVEIETRTRLAYPLGSGYFRPYPLVPRPLYRTTIGTVPVRRMTFSLGYLSQGGYGAYYY